MLAVVHRIPVLVGGPHAGERLPEYAWEQPENERQVVAIMVDGKSWPIDVTTPIGAVMDVSTYPARKIALAGIVFEVFVHDRLAYSPAGIVAAQQAILDAALAYWRGT